MDFEKVMRRIPDSQPLDFGSIFSRSLNLFKLVWLQGFITLLLTIVCILPFYILFYLPLIAIGIFDAEGLQKEELPPSMVILLVLLMPVLLLAVTSIGILFNAAFLRICKQADFGESTPHDYFYYFKREFLGKTLLLALIILGLGVLGTLLCGFGILYLMVPLSLFPAFFAFGEEMTSSQITKASFALGNKNWLVIFGLVLIMGILSQLGTLLCFVGVFFTAMLSKIPMYYMYKDALGFDLED